MKILSIILIVLFLLPVASYSEIYVIYNENTKEVYTVAEKDDTVVPEGYDKAVLQGGMKDYDFTEHPTDMKFIDGKFVVDTEKINRRNEEMLAQQQSQLDKEQKLKALKQKLNLTDEELELLLEQVGK